MSDVSPFDPSVFLDAQVTEVNEKRPTLPIENPASPDGCYTAMIGDIEAKSGTVQKQGERFGQPWAMAVVKLKITIPPELQAIGLPAELTITDRPMLDLTPQGALDNSKGKNNAQRVYRDATGMNKPGEVFAWRMLSGRPVKVKIKHEMYEGNIQERIGAILPL